MWDADAGGTGVSGDWRLSLNSKLKMMCVAAHPDDECFAFGGALALAAERGIETYVICMTDGQAATNRGDAASGAELGRMRREEFVASCAVLGVKHHELLDYQDARLEFADFSRTGRAAGGANAAIQAGRGGDVRERWWG